MKLNMASFQKEPSWFSASAVVATAIAIVRLGCLYVLVYYEVSGRASISLFLLVIVNLPEILLLSSMWPEANVSTNGAVVVTVLSVMIVVATALVVAVGAALVRAIQFVLHWR